jgi:hypothetical protein
MKKWRRIRIRRKKWKVDPDPHEKWRRIRMKLRILISNFLCSINSICSNIFFVVPRSQLRSWVRRSKPSRTMCSLSMWRPWTRSKQKINAPHHQQIHCTDLRGLRAVRCLRTTCSPLSEDYLQSVVWGLRAVRRDVAAMDKI